MSKRHLSISEKRDWLAGIFRDESGEYSQSDKFKALTEDTKLALLEEGKSKAKELENGADDFRFPEELLCHLPPPIREEDLLPR